MPMRWPAFISASTWTGAVESLSKTVEKQRGSVTTMYPGLDGVAYDRTVPKLMNADVVAIVMAMLEVGDSPTGAKMALPLWYQFAAVAYGWDPKRDKLDTSTAQGARPYPPLLTVELWRDIQSLANTLDAKREPNPRFDLDGMFTDKVFAGQVRVALQGDGADAQFKIPVPMSCREKDGTVRAARCVKKMSIWPYLCTEWERCDPAQVEIDPLKPIRESATNVFALVILVLGIWVLASNEPRRSRRRG